MHVLQFIDKNSFTTSSFYFFDINIFFILLHSIRCSIQIRHYIFILLFSFDNIKAFLRYSRIFRVCQRVLSLLRKCTHTRTHTSLSQFFLSIYRPRHTERSIDIVCASVTLTHTTFSAERDRSVRVNADDDVRLL